MRKQITIGTGITARIVTDFFSDGGPTEAELHEQFEEFKRAFARNGGLFGIATEAARNRCEPILLAVSKEGRKGPLVTDSEEAFAIAITNWIRVASDAIAENNAEDAARLAFQAGVQWGLAQMKWQWESDALRGEKVAKGLREAARQTNAAWVVQRERRFARMKQLVLNRRAENAARDCEAEGLGNWQGILRQWNRHLAKLREQNTDT